MPAPRASTDLRGEIPFSVSDHFYDRLIKRRRLPADDDGSFFFLHRLFLPGLPSNHIVKLSESVPARNVRQIITIITARAAIQHDCRRIIIRSNETVYGYLMKELWFYWREKRDFDILARWGLLRVRETRV